MVTMFGIWFTDDSGRMPPSWVAASCDLKGLRNGHKTVNVLKQQMLDNLEDDMDELVFFFSRSMAERYRKECIAALEDDGDDFIFEIKPVKISTYASSYLRKRGWYYKVDRDLQNA